MVNSRSYSMNRRKKRYEKICRFVDLRPEDRILDIGCGKGYSLEDFNKTNKIIGLDLHKNQRIFQENFSYVQGDGADLPFKDKEFDVVICVGVLEHIHPYEKLVKIANEIRRVGKYYAVIVPHYYTPIEPHFQLPLWQFYPASLKSFLIKRFNLGSQLRRPDGNFQRLNYFSREGWLKLFPDAKIASHNHIFFLGRNYVIYKRK
ncbi:MAG: methyltransferase domain-containing protein [Candidatus Aenigmatarchaeota archaeon]